MLERENGNYLSEKGIKGEQEEVKRCACVCMSQLGLSLWVKSLYLFLMWGLQALFQSSIGGMLKLQLSTKILENCH